MNSVKHKDAAIILGEEDRAPRMDSVIPEGSRKSRRDPLAIEVGKRLKLAREAKRMSIQQMADAYGWDRQTIGTWENGYAFPPYQKLIALADAYDVSLDQLLKGENPHGEAALGLLPTDMREAARAVYERPVMAELLATCSRMSDEAVAVVNAFVPKFRLLSAEGLKALYNLIDIFTRGK